MIGRTRTPPQAAAAYLVGPLLLYALHFVRACRLLLLDGRRGGLIQFHGELGQEALVQTIARVQVLGRFLLDLRVAPPISRRVNATTNPSQVQTSVFLKHALVCEIRRRFAQFTVYL